MSKKRIYCFINTIEEWYFLKKHYNDYKKIILTTSPELTINKEINKKLIILDKKISNKMNNLSKDIGVFSNLIFDKLKPEYNHNFNTQLSIFLFNFFRLVRAAMPLNKNHLLDKVLVINLETNNKKFNNWLDDQNIYLKIFSGQKNLIIKKVNMNKNKYHSNLENASFLSRVANLGFNHLEFLLWRCFWKFYPTSLSKGKFYVGVDGPFVRETLINLSRKGYKFEELNNPPINLLNKNKKNYKNIIKITLPIKILLFKWLKKDIAKLIYNIYLKDLDNFLRKFDFNSNFWKKKLVKEDKRNIKGLLSTHFYPERFQGLPDYFIENNIPICNFQHGHGREISKKTNTYYKWFSYAVETVGDINFTYNKESEKISNENPLIRGKFYSVGTPKVYNNRIYSNSSYKVIFVSTTVCKGMTITPIDAHWDDTKKVNFDIKCIDMVLKKINKKVIYKSYPIMANPSDKIVNKKISNIKNIKLIKDNSEVNYFFNKKRIIITSRSTGTLGWCVLSDLPLVFLDHKKIHYPLKKDLISHFKDSLFYFNTKDKFFFDNLRNFLNKPFREILYLWKKKESKRNILIKKYFSSNRNSAGKEASKIILNYKQ